MKELISKLAQVQSELKAPKGQFNKFGKYNYRNCEDILEAVKPLLNSRGLVLFVNDTVELIGDRFYIKATATVTDGENSVSNSAFAREEFSKKGMDASQLTGATSSYSRKYALNGLFCIDDTKDADSQDNSGHSTQSEKPYFNKPDFTKYESMFVKRIKEGKSAVEIVAKLRQTYKVSQEMEALITGVEVQVTEAQTALLIEAEQGQ